MPSTRARIEIRDGDPLIKGIPLAEILGRLEAGTAVDQLTVSCGLEPSDLVAVLAAGGLGARDDDLGPPLVQSAPPRPRLAQAVSEAALERLFPHGSMVARLALRAALCQTLDFWDASHQAAQEAEDRGEQKFAAYWHGIAHRREPDAGNASYWFRRVGRHALLPELAREASTLLVGPTGSALGDRLLRGGSWDPFAFIEICTRARPGTAEADLARRLQRLEMARLLDATAATLVARAA